MDINIENSRDQLLTFLYYSEMQQELSRSKKEKTVVTGKGGKKILKREKK